VKPTLVTGATGFVGWHVARALLERGHTVLAQARDPARLRELSGIQGIQGDLRDPASLERAVEGCGVVFHVAADYRLWTREPDEMYKSNVEGTRSMLAAARRAGVERFVYTSTVGCIGLPKAVNGHVTPSDQTTPVSGTQMTNHYKRSKWQAERVALELAGKGSPVVIVNPSAPVGPRDLKPTPTGKVIVDFLHRAMPAYLDTGLNWVHVRDVAVGHILAAEKGRVGERYILGHAQGNWTLKQTFEVLQDLTGVSAPRFQVPYVLALAAGYVDEAIARVSGRPPKAPLAGVRMARYKMFFNPAKAIRELGLPQTAPKDALRDAVVWFRANGYVKRELRSVKREA
jgi:dihydroflavonol-4-reductase